MKPTISVAIFSYAKEKYMLVNCLHSLINLKPNEICILDTSKDLEKAKDFQNWLKEKGKEYGLPIKIEYRRWDGNYALSRNAAINMCSSDWIVMLDSDEMLTKESVRDMRKMLENLPKEALVVRMRKINLLDDRYCISGDIWKKRPSLGTHPQIIKRGSGECKGSGVHETYVYPGRTTIPFNSPKHPKKDWWDYYMLHLWLYKDNPLRKWPADKWKIKQEYMKLGALWKGNTEQILKKRKWRKIKIPENLATWVPIIWEIKEENI